LKAFFPPIGLFGIVMAGLPELEEEFFSWF